MNEEPTLQLPNNDLKLILTRLDSIDARLEKLEARAYDTKPIWEKALAELIELGRRVDSIDRRLSVLNDDMLHARGEYRKLDDRVYRLEQPRAS